YHYIENDMQSLPKSLLNLIYKRAYIRKGQSRTALEYACVVTDGSDIVVFDTIGYEVPIRKSRLITRQEQIVFDMIKDKKQHMFKIPYKLYKKEYNLLSMKPELIFGLTRRERQLKQVLMMALDQLRTTNNIEELRYWLTEWNPKKYPYIRFMNEEDVWHALYDGLKNSWSTVHEELGSKLIKGHPFLERMWELEQNQGKDTTRLR